MNVNAQQNTETISVPAKKKRNPAVARFFSNRLLVRGAILILLSILIAVFAPIISPFGSLQIDPANRLAPPSSTHWFGTDNFGRDVFSRTMYGVRISLMIGAAVTIIATVLGLIVGLLSSYYKILDYILMRICDGLFAFPSILLAIAIMSALGPKTSNVIIALSLVFIPSIARIVRSAALVVKEKTFIEALKAQGASSLRIICFHMAPNVLSPLIVQVTYVFAVTILTEASLSFLGAGIPAPTPSLGNMLYDGKLAIYNAWWMTVFPGVFIILIVLGLNLFGDGLRDWLNPKNVMLKKRRKKR
ncbi:MULTISPECIES: ABC transporter permease [Priestia]|uniref:ABC transporter permease n=1 Tax=Priestia TaxID=2800373 RepID=UPI0004035BBD|nr:MULTISPECIES: ABC transporter permease [Priestia]MBK0006293.1 ABC transporter permease [Bacillus sp. S35]MCM3254504.1 ABC transporter permease [Priestia aryabhattai]MCM3639827.1 ABC transporter permease [Priestia aryabhattai]PFW79652.1 ABC transporter permease [Priestia aryabhattai]